MLHENRLKAREPDERLGRRTSGARSSTSGRERPPDQRGGSAAAITPLTSCLTLGVHFSFTNQWHRYSKQKIGYHFARRDGIRRRGLASMEYSGGSRAGAANGEGRPS